MPGITELPAASAIAATDQIAVNQGGLNLDRRASAGLLARLDDLCTFAQGISIGAAGMKLYRPTTGVLRQRFEGFSLPTLSGLTVANDSAYCHVMVISITWGLFAEFIAEGATRTLIRGNSTYFATTETAGKLCLLTTGSLTYLYNGTAEALSVSARVWG